MITKMMSTQWTPAVAKSMRGASGAVAFLASRAVCTSRITEQRISPPHSIMGQNAAPGSPTLPPRTSKFRDRWMPTALAAISRIERMVLYFLTSKNSFARKSWSAGRFGPPALQNVIGHA